MEVPVASVEFHEFVESFKRDMPDDWVRLKHLNLEEGLEGMIEAFARY